MAVSVPFPDWHSLDSRETETETREKEDGIGGETEHGRDLEISRQWGKEVVVACNIYQTTCPACVALRYVRSFARLANGTGAVRPLWHVMGRRHNYFKEAY